MNNKVPITGPMQDNKYIFFFCSYVLFFVNGNIKIGVANNSIARIFIICPYKYSLHFPICTQFYFFIC